MPFPPPKHWLMLSYEYVEDILELRKPHRDAHLALVALWNAEGPLEVAGAVGDPPRGAVFAFDTRDEAVPEQFVSEDPYVAAGLVREWRVEPWTVVAWPAGIA